MRVFQYNRPHRLEFLLNAAMAGDTDSHLQNLVPRYLAIGQNASPDRYPEASDSTAFIIEALPSDPLVCWACG